MNRIIADPLFQHNNDSSLHSFVQYIDVGKSVNIRETANNPMARLS